MMNAVVMLLILMLLVLAVRASLTKTVAESMLNKQYAALRMDNLLNPARLRRAGQGGLWYEPA